MAYRFKQGEHVDAGLRRIVADQADKAIASIDDIERVGFEEAVHDVRKRGKKIRAALRIVRPVFDDYDTENAAYRDATRRISDTRDSHVAIETFDDLIADLDAAVDTSRFDDVRSGLDELKDDATGHGRDADLLGDVRTDLVDSRERIDSWTLDADGFDAIAGGLKKVYKRARKRGSTAAWSRRAEHIHDWRKRLKYLRYQMRLLTPAAPELIGAHREALHELTDLTGDDHDLVELVARVESAPDDFGGPEVVDELVTLAEGRRKRLQDEAFALAERVLADKPKAFVHRMGAIWESWRSD